MLGWAESVEFAPVLGEGEMGCLRPTRSNLVAFFDYRLSGSPQLVRCYRRNIICSRPLRESSWSRRAGDMVVFHKSREGELQSSLNGSILHIRTELRDYFGPINRAIYKCFWFITTSNLNQLVHPTKWITTTIPPHLSCYFIHTRPWCEWSAILK